MGYKLHKNFAHPSNYGGKRSTSSIKYIVMHYTANRTDTAKANANYFKSANRKSSAHYFCDSTSVYQSVKDNVIAWSVGGSKYSDCDKTGGGKLYGKVTNANSISIEICSTNGDFAHDTLTNTVLLVRKLMKKYNIDIDHVVRHFSVTGKYCPKYWMGSEANEAKFIAFKNRIMKKSNVKTPTKTKDVIGKVKTNGGTLNMRKTATIAGKILSRLPNGTEVVITKKGRNWHQISFIGMLGYVSSKYIEIQK